MECLALNGTSISQCPPPGSQSISQEGAERLTRPEVVEDSDEAVFSGYDRLIYT